ncbi:pseudouridine synthase [Halalkalibacterium halodurans]|jgi:23S rRNA pseudouridine2605 synthase|uniref:Pseudouridine synthase n=2 Tax=Halalkalibacterium halodurans TaxID=86665 RepID=Q9KCJ5_HALH5|nr:pseudouridine synthase [Halalkalibacterium halodurans]MDY7222148.1 pseudouridine synthase [Halalkalibacterium halodurans]MDY7241369.1 pseudouridine synthase [Halalkalibacterium halodurans]MED4081851.1 pseudouridine synthase [Halalkalibacterium halodurans]MED4086412.1 pseudouridine synthase [Halalkalibacterium halodurans]MED4105052.1 pseudouridine synthase [Halalkalibacterium halodurans]
MERLQKVIAQAGIASRRKAEQLILEGKVKVNGQVVKELGIKVNPNQDDIEVEGVPVEKEEPVYFLLYKPTGVISSVKDDKGRKVVTDFLEIEQRVYPVGRLDYDTSGLLLLTNDGEFANLLMHPRHKIEKVYVAKVKGIPTRDQLKLLARGVKLEDGPTAPAKVKMLSVDRRKQTAIVKLTIHEGRNRQVRRMFETIGCEVMKLKREQFAFLDLSGMNPGDVRPLKPIEVKHLRELAVTKKS